MITLEAFSPEHFDILKGWFDNERDVVQWGGPAISHPLDNLQLEKMVAEGETSPPDRLCWMTNDGEEAIGHAQLVFDWRHGNARMARIAIAPKARGRRLAGSMLELVLRQAFERNGMERVELEVYQWNAAAINTYARLGFVQEGVRRSAVCAAGERRDSVIMAMLRPEWQMR